MPSADSETLVFVAIPEKKENNSFLLENTKTTGTNLGINEIIGSPEVTSFSPESRKPPDTKTLDRHCLVPSFSIRCLKKKSHR